MSTAPIRGSHAQVFGYPAHINCHNRADCRHALAFGGAAPSALWHRQNRASNRFAALAFPLARTGRIGLVPVFVGASAFGGLIEVIQPTFGRSTDVQDWIADIAGVVLGIMLALLYRRLRKHRV